MGNKRKKPMPYRPNIVGIEIRLMNGITAAALIGYACYSVAKNHFYIPTKRGGLVFYDESAWMTFAVFCIAGVNLLVEVLDHYDKRNNEVYYKVFRRFTRYLFWLMLVLSLVLDAVVFHKFRS
jgi:hypothetical protein